MHFSLNLRRLEKISQTIFMSRLPKFAVFIFICSILCIGIGCFLAFNARSESNKIKEPFIINPVINYHYQDLDVVIFNEDIPEQIKEYEGFKVSFNKENHTPNYVAWELLKSEVAYETDRYNKFWQDLDLEGCAAHNDYSHSGYDRGHMCPAADQKWSQQAMVDCFSMANICPQDHQLNAGAWNTLENKERQWAKRDSAIMIIAGPIYESVDTKRIGQIGVRVPSAFFKAFLAPYVESPRAIAFVYPNMSSPGNMQDYAMSIDELEEYIGFDLFSSLPDELEDKVESRYSFAEWNKSK